jgi:hypothetical protein
MVKNDFFIKVTNEDIFQELIEIKIKIEKLHIKNV